MIIMFIIMCLFLAHPLLRASEIQESLINLPLPSVPQQETGFQEKQSQDRQRFKRSDPIPVPWPSAGSPWQAWKIEDRLNVLMGRSSIRPKIISYKKRDSSNSEEETSLSVLLFTMDGIGTYAKYGKSSF